MNMAMLIAVILFVLAAVKVVIVLAASRRKSLRRWFYYTQQEIVEAPTARAMRLRKAQNILTVLFFVVAALAILLVYLFGK